MLKEKMLKKINSNPLEVAKVLNEVNRYGKVYIIVENGFMITGYRKTLKGAQNFAKKNLTQWYDDYTQDMTNNYNEVIEVSVDELTDYANNVQAWYEFFLANPEVANYYKEKKYFDLNYTEDFKLSDEVANYINEQYPRMAQGFVAEAPLGKNEEASEVSHKEEEKEVQEEARCLENVEAKVVFNEEQNGIEIYYNNKPDTDEITRLKASRWRWNRNKKCWYHKDTPEAREFITCFLMEDEEDSSGSHEEAIEISSLEPGAYTMKRFDPSTGSSIINKITINSLTIEKYAQYPKALKLMYINKGERKVRGVRFVADKIEFFKGWGSNNSVDGLELSATFINGYEGLFKNI